MRPQTLDAAYHLGGDLHGGQARLDPERAARRHHVDAGAAFDQPDVDGDSAPTVGHRLEGEHLAGQLGDGAAAILMAGAGMRRSAVGDDVVAGHTLTRGHHLAALARRLRHQHVAGLLGLGDDQVSGGGLPTSSSATSRWVTPSGVGCSAFKKRPRA
jgi:hypothetical protein